MEAKYKRVLLKISGEALAGSDRFGINEEMLKRVAVQIKAVRSMGSGSGCRCRRRKLLARKNKQEHGQGYSRLYGNAGNCNEFDGASGRIRG